MTEYQILVYVLFFFKHGYIQMLVIETKQENKLIATVKNVVIINFITKNFFLMYFHHMQVITTVAYIVAKVLT